MPSPTDPIRTLNGRIRLTWTVGALAIAAAAAWSFLSGEPAPLTTPTLHAPASVADTSEEIAPLDPRAFAALLWNPPPPPPAPKKEEETRVADRRPFLLQLIGIIEEEAQPRRAVLYDPQTDKLLIVADGESIEPYRVLRITGTTVELSDGRATRELKLTPGREPS